MSPQHKGLVWSADAERIQAAIAWKKAADVELVAAVLDAMRHGGSIHEVSIASGLSERTIIRWRKGQGLPTAEELRESKRREDAARSREWFRQQVAALGLVMPEEPPAS